jgi:hypothetical protein
MGLRHFKKKKIKDRKEKLEAQLTDKKSISSSNKHWLDNEANAIDGEHIIESLENALDYECGVGRLDDIDNGGETV